MTRRRRHAAGHTIAAIALLTSTTVAAQQAAAPLPPPPDREAAARVTLAPYRSDDLLWENDRTAHRIYGHALEAVEPPSGSGIDAWGKGVRWPFMDRQLRTATQHENHGEGIDYFHVGGTRGVGGLGIWHDNKLWTSRNWVRHRILKDGPDLADFEVDYAAWPVDVDHKVWETRRFTLPLGTHFTRVVSTIASDRPGPLTVGIGLNKNPTGAAGSMTVDRARGIIACWGPDSAKGAMAWAIRVDPASIVAFKDDLENHLVLIRVTPGKPFVYYLGSGWSRGTDRIGSQAEWDRIVSAERVDFTPPAPKR